MKGPRGHVTDGEGSRDGEVAMQTCSCGKGCNSKYRCIRIHVRYTPHLGLLLLLLLVVVVNSLISEWRRAPFCMTMKRR